MENLPYIFIRDHKSVSVIDLRTFQAYCIFNNVNINNWFNSPSTLTVSIHEVPSEDDILMAKSNRKCLSPDIKGSKAAD